MTKIIFLISILFLTISKAYSTGQVPDYLIIGQDTVSIFNNPLEQYLDSSGNRKLVDFNKRCQSSGCWRGYIAYWELINDSLFLLKITSYPDCGDLKEADISSHFGKEKPFASWYKGTLRIPVGNLYSGSDMGYNAIYEYEDQLSIENGVVKSRRQISNIDFIERMKLDNKLYSQIATLKDTLLFYINKLDWKKLDKSMCDCSDSYNLSYLKSGQLKRVELIKYNNYSTSLSDKLYFWRFDKKCSKKIKSAIKPMSLLYIDPHRDFKVEIRLFYSDHLEMWECRHYYKPISDKEVKDYVRRQIEIKE